MRIHYFQRYHQKENVATANTMLLLSRLYSYSPTKFFMFLKSFMSNNSFEPEIKFNIQEKNKSSVPDATMIQEGFKIIVETKLTDWFYEDQLSNHLKGFGDEKYKLLLTIASEPMEENKLKKINIDIKKHNAKQKYPVFHLNTTFEELANTIGDQIDDRDYEMIDILDDYKEYLYADGLFPTKDAWKYLRMQLAGTTIDFNSQNNVYYDNPERGFRPHDYLGLYTQKSLRFIGKICAIATAVEEEGKLVYTSELGEMTEERKQLILRAIDDAYSYGYDLKNYKHRYFFVDKFYETDFKKISKGGCMGTRIFDLTKLLEIEELDKKEIPDVSEIAEKLKNKTWQ